MQGFLAFVRGLCYYVFMNEMTSYKVTFIGDTEELSVVVETPLVVDCDHEDNVHTIIDLSIEIAKLTFGDDFEERIDLYGVMLEQKADL